MPSRSPASSTRSDEPLELTPRRLEPAPAELVDVELERPGTVIGALIPGALALGRRPGGRLDVRPSDRQVRNRDQDGHGEHDRGPPVAEADAGDARRLADVVGERC